MASTCPQFRRGAARAGIIAYQRVKVDAAKVLEDHEKKVDSHWIGPFSIERLLHDFMRINEDVLVQMPGQVKFDLPLREGTRNLEEHLYDTFVRPIIT